MKGMRDQTEKPQAASHLGLFCLPMSHKKDARLICVNKWTCWQKIMFFDRKTTANGATVIVLRWLSIGLIDGYCLQIVGRHHEWVKWFYCSDVKTYIFVVCV